MALDYCINQGCEVKKQLSLGGMVSLIKKRSMTIALIRQFKNEGKTDEEILNSKVKQRLQTPEGLKETEQTISGMLSEIKILDGYRVHCERCQVNNMIIAAEVSRTNDYELLKNNAGFGCYNSINYPISGKAEEWLIDRSKSALEKGNPDSTIIEILNNKKVTADRIKRMRSDPNMNFFELRKPLEITTGKGLFGKKTINTDQLLFMLFGFDRLGNDHMMALLHFSGGIFGVNDIPKQNTGCIKFNTTDNKGQNIERAFNIVIDENDDRSVRQMKQYLRSLMVACMLGQDVLVLM